MRFYECKKLQTVVVILYPVAIFLLLSSNRLFHTSFHSWTVPLVVTAVFCLLWGNLRYLFISTLLMCVIAVPLWLLLVEDKDSAALFRASLPFIAGWFITFALIPEMIIVGVRNAIIKSVLMKKGRSNE